MGLQVSGHVYLGQLLHRCFIMNRQWACPRSFMPLNHHCLFVAIMYIFCMICLYCRGKERAGGRGLNAEQVSIGRLFAYPNQDNQARFTIKARSHTTLSVVLHSWGQIAHESKAAFSDERRWKRQMWETENSQAPSFIPFTPSALFVFCPQCLLVTFSCLYHPFFPLHPHLIYFPFTKVGHSYTMGTWARYKHQQNTLLKEFTQK